VIERRLEEPLDCGRVRVDEHQSVESAGAEEACRDARAERATSRSTILPGVPEVWDEGG